MAWKKVITEQQLEDVFSESEYDPVVIFKHSPRCPLSSLELSRFESRFHNKDFYIVDVISQRVISQLIAERLRVIHESPQLLVISKKQCIHHASHRSITLNDMALVLKHLERN